MEEEFIKQRIDKLQALKEIGIEPYGRRFNKTQPIKELVDAFKE